MPAILTVERRLCLACNQVYYGTSTVCPEDGAQMAVVNESVPTELVPGYCLEREIGQGTSGKIYQATRIGHAERVAIKVLHQSLVSDLEMVLRFKKEAELTSLLDSRNVVHVRQFGLLADGRPFFVMDYIEGCTASDIMARHQALPLMRALPIFIQTAAGLAHAHAHGIMHRDIKPRNIMLAGSLLDDAQSEIDGSKDEVVKIVDFGIAKNVRQSNPNLVDLTLPGEAVGSPMYMSPEQCDGSAIDHRTDVYSLGCVMYEMLTGHPVFLAATAVDLMNKQLYDVPPPMKLSFAGAPQDVLIELERITLKALAKNPAHRYMRIDAMRAELQLCLCRLQAAGLGKTKSDCRVA